MSIWTEIKESFRQGSTLTKLIYINAGVFVAIKLLQLVLLLSGLGMGYANVLINWLSVPSDPALLLFRPWTLVTYMFLHYGFFHILFNLLYLFWFGRLFVQLVDVNKLLTVYIWGGLAGAALYIFSYNLLPAFNQGNGSSSMLGASAAVMAILFAVARIRPNFSVYLFLIGPVKLKFLALVAFIIELISIPGMTNTGDLISNTNAGGIISHIGGALVGLYYGWKLSEGKIKGNFFDNLAGRTEGMFKRKSKLRVTHSRPMSDMEYNANKIKRQKELDRILEKIKQSGYDSLSKEEKQMLFNASQEDN